MPLPLILGIGAAVAGATGAGSGIYGAVKMTKATKTAKDASQKHEENIKKFEKIHLKTTEKMDLLGKTEIEVLSSFQEFSEVIEKIHNRPEFKAYQKDDVCIPAYEAEELKKVSVGANVLLGGLGGAALGTAGAFASAGATTSAVMALGTASTGTAIASLHGVAATNATLAALGGGSLAAGGGGMALGATMLSVSTIGVGILIGGVIFGITGSKLSDKANKAYEQMLEAEKQMNDIEAYLQRLDKIATKFYATLKNVKAIYEERLTVVKYFVNVLGKTDWNQFSEEEKKCVENTVLMVSLLYRMCKVQLVLKNKKENELNSINVLDANKVIDETEAIMREKGLMVA